MDAQDFMRRAIELSAEARAADGDDPFGAVIVRDGRIVGEGRNRVGSDCDPTAHSEIMALRDASRRLGTPDLSGCEIYTSGEPCPMCMAAIWWAGLSRVVYGVPKAESGELGFSFAELAEDLARPMAERRIPNETLLTDEAIAAIRAWKDS